MKFTQDNPKQWHAEKNGYWFIIIRANTACIALVTDKNGKQIGNHQTMVKNKSIAEKYLNNVAKGY